jgi:Domain of unknown function DUF1828
VVALDRQDLQTRLSNVLASEVTLHPYGERETRVEVPFHFPDGDGFVIYFRDVGDGQMEITDHAHTLMHLGYATDIDRLYKGTRALTFERIRARHGIEDRDGELVTRHAAGEAPQGLFSFVQALVEISDLRNLDRETVRSTFAEDLRDLLTREFEEIAVGYIDDQNDRRRKFPIPYVLNGVRRPIAIFDIATDEAAASAFAIASQHARWGATAFHLVAIERDQEQLTRQHVAWISDLFDKQFATLDGNEDKIVSYLHEQHELFKRLTS